MNTDKNTKKTTDPASPQTTPRKKSLRVFAFIGILLLAALYASTLVFALIDSPYSYRLLMTSVFFTILVPVLLYTYQFLYRLLHKGEDK